MLKFHDGKNRIEVVFEYKDGWDKENLPAKFTLCVIKIKDKEEGFGVACQCSKDNFNRNTGRKIALALALQEYPRPLYFEFRKRVWTEYFRARHGKKD